MAYQMTAARRAALRKAQLASARKRRKGVGSKAKSVARSQLKYYKRKKVAQGKLYARGAKNEVRFYREVGTRIAEKATGARAKRSPKKGIAKRFVRGVKKNTADYKRTVKTARRVRNNEIKRTLRSNSGRVRARSR